MRYSKKLIKETKEWLGADGAAFFAQLILENGNFYIAHFREGMQIRNFLRRFKETNNWSSFDFDDNWIEVIKSAIKL